MSPKLLTLALLIAATNVSAEPWTYSGTLSDGDKPANGRYDLRVSLLDATRSNPIGSPITFYSVPVKDGAFTVDVDFGTDLSNAPAMRLQTEVSKNNAPFVALGEPTRFDPKVALAGVCWDTQGNAGTNPGTNFIGTTDDEPLVLRTQNVRSLLIVPSNELSNLGEPITANVIAGSSANTVGVGVRGATISGGGVLGSDPEFNNADRNYVAGSYGTVSGGFDNRALDNFTTVSGGRKNSASGLNDTVSGGYNNLAMNYNSAISGGSNNVASGLSSSVGGGSFNCAGGDYSWAGGSRGKIRPGNEPGDGTCTTTSGDYDGDNATFVWADDQGTDFTSTGARQFLVRAQGGTGINTATLGAAVDLRSSELVIRNGAAGDNTDISLMNDTNRGYNMVTVPGSGGAAGSFYIGEVDGRLPAVGFANRLQIAPNGDLSVYANAYKPGGGAWAVSSDARLKRDVSDLEGSLARLLSLHGVNFSYRDDAPKSLTAPGPQIGFIAQEVEKVFPQWIGERGGYKTVGIAGFEALTVEAMRDLKAESDVRMEALEKENALLRARLEKLEAKVKP